MKFMRLSHEEESPMESVFEDMLGFQVYDCFGSFVGYVEDLIVDADNPETISYALVGRGNVDTMLNGKDLIIPFDMLDANLEDREAFMPVAIDHIKDFPTYDTLQDPDLKDKVDSFWTSAMRPMAA